MNMDEAKTAYIFAREEYRKVIEDYDRSRPGSREARFRAYHEFKSAQFDLADLGTEMIEAATGADLSRQLARILSCPTTREKCCDEIFLNLE